MLNGGSCTPKRAPQFLHFMATSWPLSSYGSTSPSQSGHLCVVKNRCNLVLSSQMFAISIKPLVKLAATLLLLSTTGCGDAGHGRHRRSRGRGEQTLGTRASAIGYLPTTTISPSARPRGSARAPAGSASRPTAAAVKRPASVRRRAPRRAPFSVLRYR